MCMSCAAYSVTVQVNFMNECCQLSKKKLYTTTKCNLNACHSFTSEVQMLIQIKNTQLHFFRRLLFMIFFVNAFTSRMSALSYYCCNYILWNTLRICIWLFLYIQIFFLQNWIELFLIAEFPHRNLHSCTSHKNLYCTSH